MMEISNTSEFLQNIHNIQSSNPRAESQKLTDTNLEMVSRSFWDFTLKPDFITLVVEGKELHIHKEFLVKSSPVFQVMIESESFIEKQKGKIELPNKKVNEIQEMLTFLYPSDYPITEKTNIESLLNLSREYQIKQIKDMCEKFLMKKNCSINMLIVAQNYDLKDLLKKCVDYFGGKPLLKMENNPRYSEINNDICVTIKLNQLDAFRNNFETLRLRRSNSKMQSFNGPSQQNVYGFGYSTTNPRLINDVSFGASIQRMQPFNRPSQQNVYGFGYSTTNPLLINDVSFGASIQMSACTCQSCTFIDESSNSLQ